MLCASCVISLATIGCNSCSCGEPTIATLIYLEGQVTRDFEREVGAWQDAAIGARFTIGDGVQLTGRGVAMLDLGGGNSLSMQPDTIIRFLNGGARGPFAIEAGEAVLQVGAHDYRIETEFGAAVLAPNTRALLLRDGTKLLYKLTVGSAFFTQDGQRFEANVGDAILLGGMGMSLTAGQPESAVAEEVPPPQADDRSVEVEVTAEGALARGENEQRFSALGRGRHRLSSGSTLRLQDQMTARVRRGAESVKLHGAGDFLLDGDPDSALVITRQGKLEIETTSKPVEIRVPGGSIVVQAAPDGSKATVAAGPRSTRVDVERGKVRLIDGSGERELVAGEHGSITIAAARGELQAQPGPEHADVQIRDRMATVHTASLPVVVGISIDGCDGEGAVKVPRKAVRGQGVVNVGLDAGRHRYTAHCIEAGRLSDPIERGTIQVITDAGTRELPKKAPDTKVEMDGRVYTILYQNQPPQITVDWPRAQQAPSYTLNIVRAGHLDSFTTKTPRHVFPSGSLRDGEHSLTFTTSASVRSKTTVIDLAFDNAAPKASVFSPKHHGFHSGDTVQVEGVVLPGWKVSMEGGTIRVDRQNRFRGEVTTSVDHPHVVLRLSHPKGGVHYYVRRAAQ